MTDKQIEFGFWYWDTQNNFPPKSIMSPSDYDGSSSVNIACTQILEITPTEQKKLIKAWVNFLPNLKKIETLWFSSNTHQDLFDSVCEMDNLIGLNIKLSNIKSLDKITKLKKLKYLRIGSSSKLESIEHLCDLANLEVLSIENFKKISDFSSLTKLTNLKFLTIEGGFYTKQKIDSFEPLGKLQNLIYLSTSMISCPNKSSEQIYSLKNLITLNWAFDLSKYEMDRLKIELPKLKYLPNRYHDDNMKKIKEMIR